MPKEAAIKSNVLQSTACGAFMVGAVVVCASTAGTKPGGPLGPTWIVLQRAPVEVRARVRPRTDGAPFGWEVDWRITRGGECLSMLSYTMADDRTQARQALEGSVVQRGDYLFIATSAPGGNHWKGGGTEVIGLRGGRLIPLGWLGERDFESYAPDTCYHNGEFLDLDADWESAFTGHAGAPKVELVLLDSVGTLVADLARTWERSQPLYQGNERLWRSAPAGQTNDFGLVAALFENAVIAAYCHRSREWAVTMAEAERVVDPSMLAAIRDTLSGVRSGVLPRRSRPWSSPCAPREK
jgi:hypothetical protein